MAAALTPIERTVLDVLMRPGARVTDRTVKAIAGQCGLSEAEVRRSLEKLESPDPPLVHRDTDATLQVEFWIALPAAMDALEPGGES